MENIFKIVKRDSGHIISLHELKKAHEFADKMKEDEEVLLIIEPDHKEFVEMAVNRRELLCVITGMTISKHNHFSYFVSSE